MIPCRLFPSFPQRMPIALTNAQIRFLRGQAHDLKAILQVGGKGISDALAVEVDGALEHHELIKVKVAAADREAPERCDWPCPERVPWPARWTWP